MEKITRILADIYTQNIENVENRNPEYLKTRIIQHRAIVDMFGQVVARKLREVYVEEKNQNKDYNLVLLTDDELNELEKKAKEVTIKKTRYGKKLTHEEERIWRLVGLQGAK